MGPKWEWALSGAEKEGSKSELPPDVGEPKWERPLRTWERAKWDRPVPEAGGG